MLCSRGRYHQILKRNCHVLIGLTDNKDGEVEKPVKIETKVKEKAVVKKEVKKEVKKMFFRIF